MFDGNNSKIKKMPIGSEFIKRGLLTKDQVDKVLDYQKEHKEFKFAEIVDVLEMCNKSDILDTLSYCIGIKGVILKEKIDINPVKYIPRDMIINYKVIPFEENDNKLKVAFSDPLDEKNVSKIRNILEKQGYEIEVYITLYTSIMEQISKINFIKTDYID